MNQPRTCLPTPSQICFNPTELSDAVSRFREPCYVIRDPRTGHLGVSFAVDRRLECVASLPPLFPEWLGSRAFSEAHRTRFSYVAGDMAQGISTAPMVVALSHAGLLGFFGAAGLPLPAIERGIDELEASARGAWGVNLIHNPDDPAMEDATARLLIGRGVRQVSASAFMRLTPAVVRLATAGLRSAPDGTVLRQRHVMAKVSRSEVARAFMEPAPTVMLKELRSRNEISDTELQLAARLPVAQDITAEADSGGHTDNRPLTVLLPELQRIAREIESRHHYSESIRVGAAGGLGTPSAIAGAFAMGADYVLTGSVNQAAVESGLSERGRRMLADATAADVAMAPAADMFEIGARVQVLKRGTMFALRAQKLYALYQRHESIDDIPRPEREAIERDIFRTTLEDIWGQTRQFWSSHQPKRLREAEEKPRARMALMFRWYLGKASAWARGGDPDRVTDYQIWCGPAMGAFNDWVRGSFLEAVPGRTVVEIALNLLEGAAHVTRAQQLRSAGVPLPASAFHYKPRALTRASAGKGEATRV